MPAGGRGRRQVGRHQRPCDSHVRLRGLGSHPGRAIERLRTGTSLRRGAIRCRVTTDRTVKVSRVVGSSGARHPGTGWRLVVAIATLLAASAVGGLWDRRIDLTTTASAQALPPTRVIVDPTDRRGTISPLLFGANHRYPYAGFQMWDPTTNQPQAEFAARFSEAGITFVRFPGGSVANTYRWQRAIGPVAARARNIDGLTGEPQTNEFGPDEFGRFVRSQGVAGTVVVNFATGTALEAADWVEYMNAPLGTNPNGGVAWAEVRAANGQPEPYGIRYWEVGNELNVPGQEYWFGAGASSAEKAQKYAFGGSTAFTDQPAGRLDDYRPSAGRSDGAPGQVFYAKYPPVQPGSERVLVDGVAWTPVASLGAAGRRNVYRLDPSTGQIQFGDGTDGNIPPAGAAIAISYLSGTHDGFVQFYAAMKAADPSASVCSSVDTGDFLAAMGSTYPYDCLVMHPYFGTSTTGVSPDDLHDNAMLAPEDLARNVAFKYSQIRQYAGARAEQVELVLSEYGTRLFNPDGGPLPQYLASLDHALNTALALKQWMDLGVTAAGRHPLVDFTTPSDPLGPNPRGPLFEAVTERSAQVVGSLVPRAFVVSPSADVLRMLTPMSGSELISSTVAGNPERTLADGRRLSALQTVASSDAAGNLYLVVVNRDRSADVAATVELRSYLSGGLATVRTLNGASYLSYNTADAPNTVRALEEVAAVGPASFTRIFPAHSVTAITLSGAVLPAAGLLVADGFEGQGVGGAPASYALSGPAGSTTVQAPRAASGQLLQLSRAAGTPDGIGASRSFGPVNGRVRVSARVRSNGYNGTYTPLAMALLDARGTPVAMAGFWSRATMAYTDGATRLDGPRYRNDTWYRLELQVDPAGGLYDLYIDNARVATARLNPAAGPVAKVHFQLPARVYLPGTFWVDDVQVASY